MSIISRLGLLQKILLFSYTFMKHPYTFRGSFKKIFLIPMFFSKISPQIPVYRSDPHLGPLILLHVFPFVPGKHLRIPSE